MTFRISVNNSENGVSWQKNLSQEEYEKVEGYVKDSENRVNFISATLVTVRTNNFGNFSKDFFLPTTINHAIKVEHVVGKIFAILSSLVLDALTFPIRILTCIPRVISNAMQKENPLYKYLKDENVDEKLLASNRVRVKLESKVPNQFSSIFWTTNDGVKHSQKNTRESWSEMDVNFTAVPTYVSVPSSGSKS